MVVDWLRGEVFDRDSIKSEVFKVFLEAPRQKYGKAALVTDNAKSHRPKLIREYLKSTGGDTAPTCPPPHAPRLDPVWMRWRMIKARLAARCHSAADEMERSIVRLVGSGEVQPVRIPTLPMA